MVFLRCCQRGLVEWALGELAFILQSSSSACSGTEFLSVSLCSMVNDTSPTSKLEHDDPASLPPEAGAAHMETMAPHPPGRSSDGVCSNFDGSFCSSRI